MAAALAADAVIPVDAVDLAVVPAAGSGSSFFCAAVVETATDSWETTAVDVTMAADVVDLTTPACGSFSCCAAAAALFQHCGCGCNNSCGCGNSCGC